MGRKIRERNNHLAHDLALRGIKLLNMILLTAVFGFFWFRYYADQLYTPFYFRGNWYVIALFFVLFVILGKTYDAFLVSLMPISEMVYSQVLALLFSDGIMYMVVCLLMRRFADVRALLGALSCQIIVAMVWCIMAHKWYFTCFSPKESAVIYDTRQGMETLIGEYGLDKKFNIKQILDVDDCLKDLSALLGMETIFLSGIHSRERNIILKYCVYHDIDVYVIPRVGDVIMSGARQMHMFHLPVLRVGRYHPSAYYLFTKRAFDIVVSGTAMIVLSPIFILTAAAIKLTDGGPVFYKQERLTKDGKPFMIHKFRSMRVDAEKDGVARLSTGKNDDRITPVGRFIRSVRIDELPQVIDILRGDLSIVGPRPERPELTEEYAREMPEFKLRLQCKAGLTGYAQVYGKYNTTPYDKLQMDLMYIAHPSFLEDLRICFATVKILFMPESTEGVDEGRTTVMSGENR